MCYRILCRFEPNHPSMAGKSGKTFACKRGKWRVVGGYHIPEIIGRLLPVRTTRDYLFVASTSMVRSGTLVNPLRVINGYLAHRRGARA